MSLPKISIVTPSFNQGHFLEETIRSVLEQKYENLEYVVIDGGSSDNSVDIIKKYDDRLHYWVSEEDEGHGHALNKGFSRTSGEIMAWINSDDMYTPWSFKVVSEIFSQLPHVMWIMGFTSLWNDAGAMIHAGRVQKNIFDFLLGNYAWIQQESVFWRRELWEKAGGYINQNYKLMVDGELWTRFFLHEELYTVHCILGGYRLHSHNRALCNRPQCLQEMEQAISIMKQKCSSAIIESYNRLKWFQILKRSFFSKFIPVSSLWCPSLFTNAEYKKISYENKKWIEHSRPFSAHDLQ